MPVRKPQVMQYLKGWIETFRSRAFWEGFASVATALFEVRETKKGSSK